MAAALLRLGRRVSVEVRRYIEYVFKTEAGATPKNHARLCCVQLDILTAQ